MQSKNGSDITVSQKLLEEMIALKVYEMQTEVQLDLQELVKPLNLKVTKFGSIVYQL